tara:strand:- start:688 stop:876 length:189 start_codon:yes stop_codon:yes gene_type:complete
MKEKFGRLVIDLSLNRSLEELVESYWEASDSGMDEMEAGFKDKETESAFYALENYLYRMDAI